MPLYDVTYSSGKLITDNDVRGWDIFTAMVRSIHPRTLDKMIRTIDTAIDELVVDGEITNNLVWAKTASLIGYNSKQPTKDINHIWGILNDKFGGSKLNYQAAGVLVCHSIAKRTEKYWLMFKIESDEIDPETNRKISHYEYWIKDDYIVPMDKGIDSLLQKFNRRV